MDADKKKIWVSGQTIEVTDAVYEMRFTKPI